MLTRFGIRRLEPVSDNDLQGAIAQVDERSGGAWGYRLVRHELRFVPKG